MVEGAVRHGTSMQLEGNYVDSHGQSEIGLAITRPLDFDLLARIKQINKKTGRARAPGRAVRGGAELRGGSAVGRVGRAREAPRP